jgi:hypothetical protein
VLVSPASLATLFRTGKQGENDFQPEIAASWSAIALLGSDA